MPNPNHWIQSSALCESPLFRKNFLLPGKGSAVIRICGWGFFELYINGKPASEDRLVPAWTNYVPRENRQMLYPIYDAMRHRAYYMEYDVGHLLRLGKNTIAVALGTGWFAQNKRNVEGDFVYGTPMLNFSLVWTGTDGTALEVKSDETAVWHTGEILENNLFYGETHDYRRKQQGWFETDFDDSHWLPVSKAPPPDTVFEKQTCPADRVMRTVAPKLIWQGGNRRIYDCGENMTGYVSVRLPASPGETVIVRHSENITGEHRMDYDSAGGDEQIQQDTYICGFREETAFPRFTWHGFRYFEVTGFCQVEHAAVLHADIPVTSSFACSNETLNWLYETYLRTQLANFHCGVPSDCPHRERLGYTGDGQVTAYAAMLTMDSRALFEKWMRDIADGQDLSSGHVQHTAPFYGGGGGPGGWGGAIYLIPRAHYALFGDSAFLEKYYEPILLYLSYMESRLENGLVVREEEGGWCLGDWCTPGPVEIPEPFVNTYFYIKGLGFAAEISEMLGKAANIPDLLERKARCEAAVRRTYYDPETGSFCGGVNGADGFALDIGLGGAETAAKLTERYAGLHTLDTGIFGTDIVIDQLFRNGQGDLAVRLLTHSFNQMKNRGATTLWERWTGAESHNHPMFGGVVRSLFTHILGLCPSKGADTVQPAKLSGITWAKGHITTANGVFSSVVSGGKAVFSSCENGGKDV